MFSTDEDYLHIRAANSARRIGWVRFVYGNGCEVIWDYIASLEDVMDGANKLAYRLKHEADAKRAAGAKHPVAARTMVDRPMRWTCDYGPAKRRAFILDEDGFIVVPPRLSRPVARTLAREHNRILDQTVYACVRTVIERTAKGG